MSSLSSIGFLSAGVTLLVVAFKLLPLLFTMFRKKEKLWRVVSMAVLMMGLAAIVGTVPASWVNPPLKNQEVSVLGSTAVTLMVAGFVLGWQEIILAWPKEDERRKLLKVIGLGGILAPAALGIACIVAYAFLRN